MKLVTVKLPLSTNAQAQFQEASPFPHIVIDNFLDTQLANNILNEHQLVSNEAWGSYRHFNEDKKGLTKIQSMGPYSRDLINCLNSEPFLNDLSKLTGIPNLIADPDLDGGGLHSIKRNGFLNIHTDFLSHTINQTWSRQLNLLIYLNKGWDPAWEGALEMWTPDMKRCEKSIQPHFNRCVIFKTIKGSYHGHPTPLRCPENIERRSVALYYYVDEKINLKLTPTDYRATPDASFASHSLVWLDKTALRLYSYLKRKHILNDAIVQKVSTFFNKKR